MPTVNDVFVFLFYVMVGLLAVAALGAQLVALRGRLQEDRERMAGTWREELLEDFERRAARIGMVNRWLAATGMVLMSGALLGWHYVPKEDPPLMHEHLTMLGFFLGMLLTAPFLLGALRLSIGSLSDVARWRGRK